MLVNTKVPRDTKAMVAKVFIIVNDAIFLMIIRIANHCNTTIIFNAITGSSPIQCPAKDSATDHGGDRRYQQKLSCSPGQAACPGEGGGGRGGAGGGDAKLASQDGGVGLYQPVFAGGSSSFPSCTPAGADRPHKNKLM